MAIVIGALLLLSLSAVPGCGGSDDSASAADPSRTELSAAADSVGAEQAEVTGQAVGAAEEDQAAAEAAVPDTAAADTTAAKEERKGGFFQRLFGGGEEEEEEEEPVPVELAEVEIRDLPSYLTATATLEPEKQAEVLAKIDGEILRIQTEEGLFVQAGDPLALLDGAAQRVALEEAEARLHALRLDLERMQALDEEQLASQKDLEDARSAYAQAEAQRKSAQLLSDYTRIIAPFAGQIAERHVDPGQTVSVGTALFSIVDCDPLLARIHLPEREAAKILPGQTVIISPDADPDLQVRGEVLRIAPIVDARTGTVKVTCRVLKAAPRLLPGSFVRVKVETDIQKDVLCIPKRALVTEGADDYVFRAAADSVVKVPVIIGHKNRTLVEVLEGLTAGERVVAVGHGALKTGSKIRRIEPPPVAAEVDSTRGAEAPDSAQQIGGDDSAAQSD